MSVVSVLLIDGLFNTFNLNVSIRLLHSSTPTSTLKQGFLVLNALVYLIGHVNILQTD